METYKGVQEAIKKMSDEEGIITFPSMHLKLNKYDRKAIEIIETLPEEYTIAECIEILQTAICWLGILNSSKDADKEIDEGKAKGVVLTKKNK